ncbi:MAG TPA: MFS transporter, partial [Ktedonobacterales bacterium]
LTDHGPLLTVLGNHLVTDDTRWRWVFYVNMPIGTLALLALLIWLPSHLSLRTTNLRGWAALRRIDFLGAALASAATICLLLGLTWGGHQPPNGYPWNSTQVEGLLIASGALFIAFFIVERLVKEPILPLDLFKNQVFAVGALLSLTIGMALFAVAIYLPLYIQGVLGQTATNSGAVITPLTVSLAIGAVLVGLIVARIGRYQVISILGAIVLAVGAFLLTQMDANTTLFTVTRNMIVMGIGLGMLQPVLTLAVQNAIPRNRLGVGTGAVTYLRSMGSTLGVAILGAVETNVFTSEFAKRLPAGASRVPSALLTPDVMEHVLTSPQAKQQIISAASQQAAAQVAALANQSAPAGPPPPTVVLPPGTPPPTLQQIIDHAVTAVSTKIPAGPQHDQIVAQVSQQITQQMNQIIAHEVASTSLTVPAGPQHDLIVAHLTQQITQQAVQQDLPTVIQHVLVTVFQQMATQQVTDLFNSIFEAARLALATAIQHSFYVGLGVCGVVIVLTLFFKDVPLQKRTKPGETSAASPTLEEAPLPVHIG